MQAFILAGGFATRLWPLTERRAKPLLPLAGKPLLTYAIEAVPADLQVTVSTNATFADDFHAWKKSVQRDNVTISIEDAGHEDQKLGALGAIARWIREEKIDDDVLLLAGDNFANCDMSAFLKLFRGKPLVAGHDIGDSDAARAFGTIITKEEAGSVLQTVTSFEEKPAHPKSTVVSTGWWVLPRSALPVLTEHAAAHPDNVGGVFEEFLRRGIAVDCFIFKELWKDIGSFDAYMSLHREFVGEKTVAHSSASFSPDSQLKGAVDLGPTTTITSSELMDCIVFGNTDIQDCVLTRCIIDTGCSLSGIDLTDKMLRAGTVLHLKHE
ncbi:MAG: NTP transferase domain-containing protein [Candidatus Peribacteraceae bacterium]|nr:NTP transferase domain-containing protein [Candidatus Peribacteraceae bacterium]